MYNNNYDTCEETYLTLRIYYDKITPNELTQFLGLKPTETQTKGQQNNLRKNKLIEMNAWFLSSENIDSKDSRRHIDYLLDILLPVKSKLKSLIEDGGNIDLCCYWKSKTGQGGPTLSQQQFFKLSDLGFDLWFDIY